MSETKFYRSNPGGPSQLGCDDKRRLTPSFAVFNQHINNAGERADAEFKAIFGEKRLERTKRPHADGIMTILEDRSWYARVWVVLVTAFANEARRPFYAELGVVGDGGEHDPGEVVPEA